MYAIVSHASLVVKSTYLADISLPHRLWSSYRYGFLSAADRKAGMTKSSQHFHQLVIKSIKEFESCMMNNTIKYCAFDRSIDQSPV